MITPACLLAFVPLIDPLSALFPAMDDYWLVMIVPLVLAISIVYKTTRMEQLSKLPKAAIIMSVQIVVVMAAAAVALDLIYQAVTRYF